MDNSRQSSMLRVSNIGLILGALLLLYFVVSPAPENLNRSAWLTAGVMSLMAVWWATEAVPLTITSLMPVILIPALEIATLKETTSAYASPVMFLLIGGLMIGVILQKWNLHKRLSLYAIRCVGTNPAMIVFGIVMTTATLSMWINNTSAIIMMIPIALSISEVVVGKNHSNHAFTTCIILGVAYAANLGGVGTIIGSPPNAIFVAYLEDTTGTTISFVGWMMIAVPLMLILLAATLFVLTKIVFRFDLPPQENFKEYVEQQLAEMGLISTAEKRAICLFVALALGWVFRPLLQQIPGLGFLTDTHIPLIIAIAAFIIPSGERDGQDTALLDWKSANAIPWDVLFLLGGGLCLAYMASSTGLAVWLGSLLLEYVQVSALGVTFMVVLLSITLTSFISNTATVTTMLPVLAGVSAAAGMDPEQLLIPLTITASCAFLLPASTTTNILAYSTGKISIAQMVRAGSLLSVLSVLLVSPFLYFVIPLVLG
ncbi:DASS family sodium-coupled anion symporter [Pseudomaricurvus hydrocarbonicus]|uniref:DASS family sodium-coupled anion symporter n=1 Tax=Pseudomaricurvus hydrocarbonicus TaxID=1470433 RepID=UPI001422A005